MPALNTGQEQTNASMQRMADILAKEKATLWINHDKAQLVLARGQGRDQWHRELRELDQARPAQPARLRRLGGDQVDPHQELPRRPAVERITTS